MEFDFKTVVAALNTILFVVIIPLLKYIWSNHLKNEAEWKHEFAKKEAEWKREFTNLFNEEIHELKKIFDKGSDHFYKKVANIETQIKELEGVIANSAKEERQFWQGVFNRQDQTIKDLGIKVNLVCRDVQGMKGTCDSERNRLDQRINGRVDVCNERHKK